MGRLRELNQAYREVSAMLYDSNFDEQTVLDTLEAIEGSIEEKANGYATIIQELDNDIKNIEEEIKRLEARKKTISSKRDWLKANLKETMTMLGMPSIKTSLYSFSIRKSGNRALILNCEVRSLPKEMIIVTESVNKEAIKEFMKESGVDSCEYGYLAPAKESLIIK